MLKVWLGRVEGEGMERVSTRGVFSALAVAVLALVLGAVADAQIRTNPANDPRLKAARSTGTSTPGTRARSVWR